MIKVLQVICEPFECGGQELLICNLFRNIDKSQIIFDFFTPYMEKNDNLVNEMKSYGSKFYPYRYKNFFSLKNRVGFFKELKKLLKNNKYDIIHINSVSVLGLLLGSIVAKRYGQGKIIVHSHNDGNKNIKYKFIKLISSFPLKYNCDAYLACSGNAAVFKFPKSVIKRKKYYVLKNGIDIEKFRYNECIRKIVREKLGIENKFVLGHVGRFEEQKNHNFLIDLFYEYSQKNENAVLLLVGNGSLLEGIQQKIKDYSIEKKVIYLGIRDDVNELLQAMDVFVFPSIFEGLGISVIEAQASGLNVICSDKMPKEVELSDILHKLPLEDKYQWVVMLNKLCKVTNTREKYAEIIKDKGYSIKDSSESLLNIYRKLVGEQNE